MSSRCGLIEHTADLGLWVEAEGLAELFEAAALALARVMVAGPREGDLTWRELDLQAGDLVELMVQMLGEVVYLWDAEGLLVAAAQVQEIGPRRLRARLGVVPADPERHAPGEPVKAVTYHRAKVERQGEGWRAEVILDV
ncbi:MAG: archease [Desulfarculus sp.]|nr:MAG: archease [Desulfarculus sp.]